MQHKEDGTKKYGKIVILNGTPRSGKSSIVAQIQADLPGVWMNLGVDNFMKCTPALYQPGMGLRPGGERPDLEPLIAMLYAALYESVIAHSHLGVNVVVDVGHHDAYSTSLGTLYDAARRLQRAELPALLVGVRCPFTVIMKRRRETGWPMGETEAEREEIAARVRLWQEAVHTPGIYDIEVDTSRLTSQACAETIATCLARDSMPTALARLATMGIQ
jgi:chloramphenicol 3-O phosphotransferase